MIYLYYIYILYIYVYLDPKYPLYLKVNPPKSRQKLEPKQPGQPRVPGSPTRSNSSIRQVDHSPRIDGVIWCFTISSDVPFQQLFFV